MKFIRLYNFPIKAKIVAVMCFGAPNRGHLLLLSDTILGVLVEMQTSSELDPNLLTRASLPNK
jgi:hypothetical protein